MTSKQTDLPSVACFRRNKKRINGITQLYREENKQFHEPYTIIPVTTFKLKTAFHHIIVFHTKASVRTFIIKVYDNRFNIE